MGMLLNNIGIVYSQLGNYEESTKYYQKAIDMALGISGGKILWEAYLEMADSYKRQGKMGCRAGELFEIDLGHRKHPV